MYEIVYGLGGQIELLAESQFFFSFLPPPGVLPELPLPPLYLQVSPPPVLLCHNLPVLRDLRDMTESESSQLCLMII